MLNCLQVSKMNKWKANGVDPDTRTAINTEWGCYGSMLLPRVKEDLELDAASGPQQGERGKPLRAAGIRPARNSPTLCYTLSCRGDGLFVFAVLCWLMRYRKFSDKCMFRKKRGKAPGTEHQKHACYCVCAALALQARC